MPGQSASADRGARKLGLRFGVWRQSALAGIWKGTKNGDRTASVGIHKSSTAFNVPHHGGNHAFYAPARDLIQLPPFEAFKDKESYYATVLHELTH
jgi:hypothetical protein